MTIKVMGSQKTSHLSEAHAMLGAPPARPHLFEVYSEGLTTPGPVCAQCSASGTRSGQGQGLPWIPQLLRAELSTAHLRGQRGAGQSLHSVAQSADRNEAEKAPGNRNCVTSVITALDTCTLVVGWKGRERSPAWTEGGAGREGNISWRRMNLRWGLKNEAHSFILTLCLRKKEKKRSSK